MRSIHSSMFCAAAVAALASSLVAGADQTVTWHYNSENTKALGKQIRIKQCESVTFEWNEMMPHDVFEFTGGTNRGRKKRLMACNPGSSRGGTEEHAGSSPSDTYVFNTGTSTAFRYFYCSIGSHCSSGGMKAVVKVAPDYVAKYNGFTCDGSGKKLRKPFKSPTMKKCRRRCQNGCMGFQFDKASKECVLYKTRPGEGSEDANFLCWAARDSCPTDTTDIDI